MGNVDASHAAGPGSIPGRVSLGFFLNCKTNVGNLGYTRTLVSYGYHILSKPYVICLWMAMISDHSYSTRPSLNNKNNKKKLIYSSCIV